MITLKRNTEIATGQVDPELVYGTIREVIAQFKKDEKLKNVEFRPKSAVNVGRAGKQMMFIIKEVNPDKLPSELVVSDDLFLSVAMSDQIRSGELHTSALLDFELVHHTNESNGADYPLIVRPTGAVDNSVLDKFAVNETSTVSKAYEWDASSTEDVLALMNI